jgi:hypothetical protein
MNPTPGEIAALTKALGVSADALLGHVADPKNGEEHQDARRGR